MGRIWMTGGGGGADLDVITAGATDVLDSKVIVDKEGNPLTGTMPNHGAISKELLAGDSYTIPEGYHNGNGAVTAKDLASQTSADALTGDIRKNKTAWANGEQLTGSMSEKAAASYTPRAAAQTIVANQYLAGAQTIAGDSRLIASNIKKGVTIFGVTGTFQGYVAGPGDLYKYGNNAANFYLDPVEAWDGSKAQITFNRDHMRCTNSSKDSNWGDLISRKSVNISGYKQVNIEFRSVEYSSYWAPNWVELIDPNNGDIIYADAYNKAESSYIPANTTKIFSTPFTISGNKNRYLSIHFVNWTNMPTTQWPFTIRRIWLS